MSSSVISNRISTVFSPEVLAAAIASLASIMSGLGEDLISLGEMDRRTLPHLTDTNEAFVFKAQAYMASDPEFLQSWIDVGEFQKDVDVVLNLRPLRRTLRQLLEMMDDTSDLAGGEALMVALLFYAAVKAAAKAGVPKAVTIAEDMGKLFVAQGRSRKSAKPAKDPSDKKD